MPKVKIHYVGGTTKQLDLSPEELVTLRAAKTNNEGSHAIVVDGKVRTIDCKNILEIEETTARPELVAFEEAQEAAATGEASN